MKRPLHILFIAYLYPPAGGGGVQRSAKFVKYLKKLGYRIRVLTTKPEALKKAEPIPLDRSMLEELSEVESDVVRVADPSPVRLRRILEKLHIFRLVWTVFYPLFMEPAAFWCRKVGRVGVALAGRENVDLVYTTSAPYLSSLAGWMIKKASGIPWVADYRDPWTDDFALKWPTRLHYLWERRLQKKLMARADAIIANTPQQKELYVNLLGETFRDRIVVITNGFDADDFSKDKAPAPARADRTFRMVYTGTLDYNPGKLTGGGLKDLLRRLGTYDPGFYRMDTYGFTYIAPALSLIKKDYPELYRRLTIHVYGYMNPYQREVMEIHDVADCVTFFGQVEHQVSVDAVRSADALLLPLPACRNESYRYPKVHGKTYEYMITGKPVLAPISDGDNRDFLQKAGVGVFAKQDDPKDIADAILGMLKKQNAGEPIVTPDWEIISRFERKKQASQLAELFEKTIAETEKRKDTI